VYCNVVVCVSARVQSCVKAWVELVLTWSRELLTQWRVLGRQLTTWRVTDEPPVTTWLSVQPTLMTSSQKQCRTSTIPVAVSVIAVFLNYVRFLRQIWHHIMITAWNLLSFVARWSFAFEINFAIYVGDCTHRLNVGLGAEPYIQPMSCACIEIKRKEKFDISDCRSWSCFIDTFTDKLNSVQLPVFLWLFCRDRAISQSLLTQCLDSHFIVHRNFTHDSRNQLTSGYT